ncbi:MAG: DUF2490 domain-containing protein [Deltaproteobacteria bacterium]|nr:DUF2490 domain-containing protein [Deltaproteobacteria bacterium]
MEGKLSEDWKVRLEEKFKFSDGMEELYLHETDIGLIYKMRDWFYLDGNYRQIYEKKGGVWKEENRPFFSGTFKWNWVGLRFEDRNRFEYRNREDAEDIWRYRNRLTVEPPVKWTRLDIQPYVADEIFVVLYGGGVNTNRVYIGFKARLTKRLKADISYLWQMSKKGDDWIDKNVIEAKLRIEF